MSNFENVHSFLSSFMNDFKAETIAAEIIEQGVDMEQVIILHNGAMKRPYSRDVLSMENEHFDDHTEYTVINTAREGIYDMLPQGLFHLPAIHKPSRSQKDIMDIMKKRKEEEMTARKFFIPFEVTINSLRIEMALTENRFDKQSQFDDLIRIFSRHWEILNYLDSRQSNLFLHLIPIMHDIRGNLEMIVDIIKMMFKTPANLHLRNQSVLMPEIPMNSILGENRLGVNLTTGNISFDDGSDELVLTIGPVDAQTYRDFMPEGKNKKILDLLCDYLIPVNIDLITNIELIVSGKQARLAGDHVDVNCRLGEDMVLM